MSLKRTVVIGTSCSGKTTFAKRLAQLLGVQHIELDAINWLPNWTERPNPEFRILVETAVAADEWIVDGNYCRTRDIVWSRATAIIWLDYSFPLVLSRAFNRTIKRIFDREVLFSGNRESFRMAFLSGDSILLWVLKTYRRRRREYSQLLQQLQGRQLEIRAFRIPEEAEMFLSTSRGKTRQASNHSQRGLTSCNPIDVFSYQHHYRLTKRIRHTLKSGVTLTLCVTSACSAPR